MNNNLCLFELSNIIIMTHQQVGVVKALIAFSSKFNLAVTSALVVIAIIGGAFQLYSFNIAMRFYNNIDIILINHGMILIMMLLCGWILLDEIKFYTWL